MEETYDSMAQLAAANPNLLTWTDTGDSWDKAAPGGAAGYDLYTMLLTNKAVAGPKPKFFLMAAIHAREYATAELGARFVEKLVADYGVDPDATWLVDHYELHAVFQVNPDGRKKAESGLSWRKNTDNDDGCKYNNVNLGYYPGTDLNRNSSFKWDTGGSDDNSCGETYHGPTPASEPETQHVESYMAGIFGDHRGPGDTDPAPADTEGVMITLHSYGNSVLYPWGWLDTQLAPNDAQLQTLGRKFGFYNNFEVCQAAGCYYIASGGTDDYAYGTLGIPGYTFEVGTKFFQECSVFTDDILPRNLPALKYTFKAARRPYQDPAGPEPYDVAVSSGTVARGASVTLTAKADDTRYNSGGYGTEPNQNVVGARYTIDTPSWKGGVAYGMAAADGAFDSPRGKRHCGRRHHHARAGQAHPVRRGAGRERPLGRPVRGLSHGQFAVQHPGKPGDGDRFVERNQDRRRAELDAPGRERPLRSVAQRKAVLYAGRRRIGQDRGRFADRRHDAVVHRHRRGGRSER